MEKHKIIPLLPGIFQQSAKPGNPLFAFLSVMEVMHADSQTILKNLDSFFDPVRTDENFIRFLLKWVDMDWLIDDEDASGKMIKKDNLRLLIANAWYLSKWRGTAKGLIMFLETATGVKGFLINENAKDEKGMPLPFHIIINVPENAVPMLHIIERIIEKEKPAYVTHETKILIES
ncbi:phage tail protein [Desulfobacter curvatus]|uniref:phage tail protein n=1 Tax=Desulfobacter curvatus TaxID=2290 RepID=UPI000367E682|nr:phage tail protein [Desulfobacter curvatus]